MIEKREAMENLEDILAVDGVDMVQFGAVDYALSIGNPGGRYSDEVQRAQETMVETALEMGVTPRAEIKTADDAEEYLDKGVRHFSLDTDVNILNRFWEEQGTALETRLDNARES